MRYEIFTDGSCRGNPGPGGWGVLIKNLDTGSEEILRGGDPKTTNNIMELTAVIRALEEFEVVDNQSPKIKIYSDSNYVVKGITEWMVGWIAKGWKTAARKPVKNKELWKQYLTVSDGLDIELEWVKAHNGQPENELVDDVAFSEASKF